MTAPLQRPLAGDLLLRPDAGRSPACTVQQLPGDAQIVWATLDLAIESARRFAGQFGVDVWSEEAGRLARIAQYRR